LRAPRLSGRFRLCARHIRGGSDHQEAAAEVLSQASGLLNDRERHIIEASRLAKIPITLRGLPRSLVSHESVRLIGVRALEKVQTAVGDHLEARERARAERGHDRNVGGVAPACHQNSTGAQLVVMASNVYQGPPR
jgi:hypothetical protein